MSLFPVSAIWDGQAPSPQERPTLFKLRNWLCAYEKGISYCPSPPKPLRTSQNLRPTPLPTKAWHKVTEISFPYIHSPSVPCWKHKRIGKWKLSLRKTLYRRKAFICLCVIVPWTLLEEMVTLCQRICQTVLCHGPTGGVMNTVCSGSLLLGTPWTFTGSVHSTWGRQGL